METLKQTSTTVQHLNTKIIQLQNKVQVRPQVALLQCLSGIVLTFSSYKKQERKLCL